ncbi:hypothetical protein BJY01DRAFT_175079 [Aspergillus pseudoustus]|uniref:Secreted protein n=1 Tax=Aspergillus pseudoustus TaxID=1810923 RepID=A0ABR4K292_9EURO
MLFHLSYVVLSLSLEGGLCFFNHKSIQLRLQLLLKLTGTVRRCNCYVPNPLPRSHAIPASNLRIALYARQYEK